MALSLLVFVCEGPTCGDRWGAAAPRAQIGRELSERGLRDRVQLESEICFGHCQRGPNLIIQPYSESARWAGPDQSAPGARVHHDMNVAQAVRAIAERLPGEDLAVAANPEVA